MKTANKFILIASLILASAVNTAKAETLFSEKGYPYRDLIQRAEQVKIIYSENKQDVTCKVEVNHAEHPWISQDKTTSQDEFNQAPLASCLSRKEAIALLAKTYES